MRTTKRIDRLENRIVHLFVQEGYSIQRISKTLKMCHKNISKKLKSLGINTRLNINPRVTNRLVTDKLAKLYLVNKMTLTQIAKVTDIGPEIIGRTLRRRGIDTTMNSPTRHGVSLLEAMFYIHDPRMITTSEKNTKEVHDGK